MSGVLRGLGDARQSVRDAEAQKARNAALAGRGATAAPANPYREVPTTDYAASIGTYPQILRMEPGGADAPDSTGGLTPRDGRNDPVMAKLWYQETSPRTRSRFSGRLFSPAGATGGTVNTSTPPR